MSDETRDAVTAAIQAHLTDEWEDEIHEPPMVTDWVIACAAVGMDAPRGSTAYSWWTNGSAWHSTRGLVSLLKDWTRDEWGDEE